MRLRLVLVTLMLLSTTLTLAQKAQQPSRDPDHPSTSSLVHSASYDQPRFTNWYSLAVINPSGKLFVITTADPTHRHACRVQSFSVDQLICKGGRQTNFRTDEIAALIVPGNHVSNRVILAAGNAILGAAIWGTIVLAPVCPLCAAITADAAFSAFGFSEVTLVCNHVPDAFSISCPARPSRSSSASDLARRTLLEPRTPNLGKPCQPLD